MEDYIDYIMDELHQEGLELGLEGKELNDYIAVSYTHLRAHETN